MKWNLKKIQSNELPNEYTNFSDMCRIAFPTLMFSDVFYFKKFLVKYCHLNSISLHQYKWKDYSISGLRNLKVSMKMYV